MYNQINKYFYTKYMKKYVSMDGNYVESMGTGKIISIISKWVSNASRWTYDLIENVAALSLLMVFTVYMISQVSIYLSVLFVWLLFLAHVFSYFLNKKMLRLRKQRIEKENITSQNLVKILMSKFEILQSHKIDAENKRLIDLENQKIDINLKMATHITIFFRISDWLTYVVLFITFIYFGWLYFDGLIEASVLVWISWAMILMQTALFHSVDFFKNFTQEFTEIQVMFDFFEKAPQMQWYETGKTFKYKKWDIKMQDLTFWYNEKNTVFSNFNISIEWWKITALVGNSGSWKSTLVKLIAWYIHSDDGEVIIDNQKISEISLKSYYKEIWYLTQEPSVFDGTIYENLTYALTKKVPKKKIEEIIKLAKCEFIYDFPNGLQTEIWEKWIRLSWWQRQRLAIAKIFLKDPKIIILDEPTSALDSFSEEQITQAMHNLFKDRTVIVIAHRLQTVKHADKIYVLESGEIKEEWTHTSLVRKKWIYKKMLDLQSGF